MTDKLHRVLALALFMVFVSGCSTTTGANEDAALEGKMPESGEPDGSRPGQAGAPSDGAGLDGDGNESLTPGPIVAKYSGTHPAIVGVCHEETGSVMAGQFTVRQNLEIPPDTTTSIVEARWNGTVTSACIELSDPDGSQRVVFQCLEECLSATEMRGEWSNPGSGDWLIQLGIQGPGADVAFDLAVSSFYEQPPAGYSAW